MYQDFLHLKNKENGMDDEFHGRILWDLIKLNHISYWNHDEHPKKNRILFHRNRKIRFYHEIIIP
jgi:hypothetical protein